MDMIFNSIEEACKKEIFFPAILTALTIPDIAGAVEYPEGTTSRYSRWLDSYFIPLFPNYPGHKIDGLTIYGLRCKLLHEGQSDPSAAPGPASKSAMASKKRMIAFSIGKGIIIHFATAHDPISGESRTILNADDFCREIVYAGRTWMEEKIVYPGVREKIDSLVDIRFDVPGLVKGLPLICASV